VLEASLLRARSLKLLAEIALFARLGQCLFTIHSAPREP